jgi:hypothetical protein
MALKLLILLFQRIMYVAVLVGLPRVALGCVYSSAIWLKWEYK